VSADVIDFCLVFESFRLQVSDNGGHRPIVRDDDKGSTHASPERCNAWKRAGGIFDTFRLGQNKGIQPLLCHQPLRAAPVKKSGNQSAYFVVRL
jgi:hypothetical protein